MSLLASLRPHIHRFCVLACIFASSHPHILRFISVSLYPRILAFSCPQAYECLLLSLHFTSSYHQVHVSLLVSSQAFVLDFYHTSKKIYRKQPLRADLNKVVAKISTESLKNTCKRNIFFRKVTSQKSASLLGINSFTEIFQRPCSDLTNLLLFLKIPRLPIFQNNILLLQIYIWLSTEYLRDYIYTRTYYNPGHNL